MIDKSTLKTNLYTLYDISNKGDDFQFVIDGLDSMQINRLVNLYIYNIDNYSDEDIEIVTLIVKILQNIYNNSELISPVTNEDYDKLYEIMIEYTTDIVGAEVSRDKVVGHHKYPDLRGTLDKVHFITNSEKGTDKRKSIEDWMKSIKSSLGKDLDSETSGMFIFPKFDGISVVFECDKDGNVIRALTRGDVIRNEAIDITPLFKDLMWEPIDEWEGSEFGVKTEVLVTDNNFDRLCKNIEPFKNPRSAASSIINSQKTDVRLLKYLTVVPLRVQNFDTKEVRLHPMVFTSYPYTHRSIKENPESLHRSFNELKETMDSVLKIPTDGVVLYLINKDIREMLGRKDAINKYEIAYKFPPVAKKTTLLDVEFCTGVLGRITPVAKIEPVKINGNTISSVSLGSVDRFQSLSLRKNSEVLVKYDIIPYIYVDETCKSSKEPIIKVPTKCKYCGETLEKTPLLSCTNIYCSCRIVGKITNYVEKMNIPYISIGTITTLFDNGLLRSIEDLYRLKDRKDDIVELDGFGKKSFNNIIKGIESSYNTYDYNVLGSIGISGIGRKMFKKILNIYYIDELIDICIESNVKKLTSIPGIKEKTANAVIVGILTNIDLVRFLFKELNPKQDDSEGKTKVLFTKVKHADDFKEYLTNKGIEVCDSYNKEVDIVICPEKGMTSTKLKRAEKDNKKIITLEEAYTLFEYDE